MRRKLAYLLCFTLMFALLASGCQNTAANKKPMAPSVKKPTQETRTDSGMMTVSERRVMANKLSKMAEEVKGVDRATVVIADIGVANNITGNSKSTSQMNRATSKNMNDNTIGSDAGINRSEPQKIVVLVGLTLKSDNRSGSMNNNRLNDNARLNGNNRLNDVNGSSRIKTEVMNKLKKHDKRISQVLVTTDPNLVKRISDVATGILEGKPIKNFEKDIKDIDSRVRDQGTAAF